MKRYNSYTKKYIRLEEGECFCKKCHGTGVVRRSNIFHKKKSTLICSECLGEGKLDWVEKATGKRKNRLFGEDQNGTNG